MDVKKIKHELSLKSYTCRSILIIKITILFEDSYESFNKFNQPCKFEYGPLCDAGFFSLTTLKASLNEILKR